MNMSGIVAICATCARVICLVVHPAESDRERLDALPRYRLLAHDQDVLDIVQTHHEPHDGSGYPSGLIGSGIPVAGRMLISFWAATQPDSSSKSHEVRIRVWNALIRISGRETYQFITLAAQ